MRRKWPMVMENPYQIDGFVIGVGFFNFGMESCVYRHVMNGLYAEEHFGYIIPSFVGCYGNLHSYNLRGLVQIELSAGAIKIARVGLEDQWM